MQKSALKRETNGNKLAWIKHVEFVPLVLYEIITNNYLLPPIILGLLQFSFYYFDHKKK